MADASPGRLVGRGGMILVLVAVSFATVIVWAFSEFLQKPRRTATEPAAVAGDRTVSDSSADDSAELLRKPRAQMVGSKVCAECHSGQHQSYLLTAHSQAMSVVEPDHEPANGEFFHAASGRKYRVDRQDGQLWHSETFVGRSSFHNDSPPEPVDPPLTVSERVKYLVGSGRHSRTYLVEKGGFLTESPITWYASTQRWGMSPGYDHPHHSGFERAADDGCLVCHIGQVSSPPGSYGRSRLMKLAIGCERCHGPGSEHVAYWQSREPDGLRIAADSVSDSTIVHPGRLSRELGESLCAQCHLRGDATVFVTGSSVDSFRPGTSLRDVRIDYHLESGSGDMKVVGHLEQMYASKCYQQSSTLTCTTCHDTHASETIPSGAAFYRNKCLECHESSACGLDLTIRLQKEPRDHCVSCHMPQVATDIPHIAFTHHRIGIHAAEQTSRDSSQQSGLPAANAPAAGRLLPFGDVSHLSAIEQQRCLGLAYTELCYKQTNPAVAETYRVEALRLLDGVLKQGQADGEVLTARARFAWEDRQAAGAFRYAQQALMDPRISSGALCNSLFIVADGYAQQGRFEDAERHFARLVTLRRNSEDWLLYGLSQFRAGNPDLAAQRIKQAIDIQPFRAELHAVMADILKATGQAAEAAQHARWAQQLSTVP